MEHVRWGRARGCSGGGRCCPLRLQLLAELRARDIAADARLRYELVALDEDLTAEENHLWRPRHLRALYEGTQVTGTPEVVLLRGQILIEGDDVRVRAHGDRALARIEPEQLRRVRAQQLDHPVQRDPAAADAELVDHLQPVLEARPAVRGSEERRVG